MPADSSASVRANLMWKCSRYPNNIIDIVLTKNQLHSGLLD